MNKLFLIFCITLFLTACNQQSEEVMNMKKAVPNMSLETLGATGYGDLVKKITTAVDKAKSVGGLWNNTGSILEKAKSIASTGNYDKAIKMAKTVLFQAKSGYEQAISQKNIGNPDYLYQK